MEQALNIRIEPHTVYELQPLMGGSWNVAVFKLDVRGGEAALKEVHSMPASPLTADLAFAPHPHVPSRPPAN